MLKAAGLPPEDVEQVLKGGETEAESSTRLRAEKRAAERSTTVKSVTEHRLDEKIVVKGDPSQGYIDNSLKVIKADPKEKERELKMKALAGSTDFMKAALSGQVDVLTTILTATPSELKKTDAEGRTRLTERDAMHIATISAGSKA